MGNFINKLLIVCTMFLMTNFINAQTIIGTIQDATGALPGVTVAIVGSAKGTTTDIGGQFKLTALKAGAYTLQFSFIGYKTIEKTVSVTDNGKTDLGVINLEPASESLAEVVVNGTYLPSQMAALNMQKKAPGIMNVLASDAIGKLPDRNAAEAVQRIQGVSIERDHGEGRYVIVRGTPIKWNANLINGNRLPASEGTSNDAGGDRAVPLDIFPSEMIQFVQLSKAITPDMEGDAIGGSVNFITRTAPAERTFSVSLAGGINGQAQAGTYNGSVLYGDRFLGGKLGLIASAAIWDRSWATDNYEVAYNAQLEGEQQFSISDLELRDYIGRRSTLGFNLGAEYNLSEDNKIFVRGIYSDFQDNESAREHIYQFPVGDTTNMGTATLRTRNGIQRIQLQGGELGGEHQLNSKFAMNWKVSTYQTELTNGTLSGPEDYNDSYQMAVFNQAVEFGGISEDGYKFIGSDHENIQPNAITAYDPDATILGLMYAFQQRSLERDIVGQLDFTYNATDALMLKFGGKYRSKYREGGAPLTISLPGAALGIPDAPITPISTLTTEAFPTKGGFLTELGENYENILRDHITLDQLHNMFSADFKENAGMIDIVQDEESTAAAASFYDGNENVLAGYIMADFTISEQLKLIGGVRHEMTMLEYNGNQVDSFGISNVSNNNTTHAFLPMFHIKYSPNDNANIRLAYTRTFARPDFGSLNPGTTVDEINRIIVRGNPLLESTFANNFDLMAEYYFDNVGVVSGGVFYKQITNDIFNSTNLENIDGLLYSVVEPRNLEQGYLAGFEVGISKRLDFLPGAWSGLGIDANYTYTDSEVDVPNFNVTGDGAIEKTTTAQKLPSQADHIFNASIFYEKYGLLARLAANYKGSYIVSFSDFGPEHNRYYGSNLTLDFSAAYKISNKVRIFAEVNNLTNAPLYYYHGEVERPEQVEFYSIRGQIGIRYAFFE
ncbi:MAG: TonB-dependent receptor [Bacteroidota bacterium]